MSTEAVAARGGGTQTKEYQAIGLVSLAHFVAHFHSFVLPPLFPFLTARLGIGFVELGLALTVYNILSVAAQLPVGYLVDRLGARRLLIVGLVLGGLAFVTLGLAPSYPALLIAAAVLGLANSIYHPADYTLLSSRIAPVRVGRAFSVHTFAGFLGSAVAPIAMLALAASAGLDAALMAAGIFALVAALPLALARGIDSIIAPATRAVAGVAAPVRARRSAVLTPAILGLTGFFALLSLSSSGISNFSVVALTSAYGTPLSVANLALSAYLTTTAFGVLAGGVVADLTRRHAEVAAVGYAVNAGIVLLIGALAMGTVPLVAAMGLAGFLGGLIMPSRDMLVRAAAPPGAMGRTFGIVTTGFNIGGTLGPLLYGFIMDRGAPRWVFGASVIIMIVTAVTALVGDRRLNRWQRRMAASPQAAE